MAMPSPDDPDLIPTRTSTRPPAAGDAQPPLSTSVVPAAPGVAVTADAAAAAKVRHANEMMLSAQGLNALQLLRGLSSRDRKLVLCLTNAQASPHFNGRAPVLEDTNDDGSGSWIFDNASVQQRLRALRPPSMSGPMADTVLSRRTYGMYAAMMTNAFTLGLTEEALRR